MDHVSVEIFRSALGSYLNQVHSLNKSFIVTRNGSPFVLLAPACAETAAANRTMARDLRRHMSQMLGQVHFQGSGLLIIRRGKPVAMVTRLPFREVPI